MVRRWLLKYWPTLATMIIGLILVLVMVRLADVTSQPPGTYDPRLDGVLMLIGPFTVGAIMALRNWARKHADDADDPPARRRP